jgi:oligopeptide/dipeptide ABC transporter ATP-binding protein
MVRGDVILEVRDLVKHFPLTQGILFKKQVGAVRAVDGVSFDLHEGETLGVVGESGCGKSTLARLLMALDEPTSGQVRFRGEDVFGRKRKSLKAMRRNIQIVLQDPYTSLNPRMTVGDIIGEPFDIHPEVAPRGDRRRKVQELLDEVGLNPEHINRYPHQFSGGQRQRIGIARGLALEPEIIICDEPVSALDVSVQAQVVNLLEDLQDRLGLSYIFIAHDLSVVRHISDRVAVMYLGRIVEVGSEDDIYENSAHPYTRRCCRRCRSSIRSPGRRRPDHAHRRRAEPGRPALGLPLPTRCWKAQDICAAQPPELVDRGQGHPVACHFAEAVRIGRRQHARAAADDRGQPARRAAAVAKKRSGS